MLRNRSNSEGCSSLNRKTQPYQELCKIIATTERKFFGGMVEDVSKTLIEKCTEELSSTESKRGVYTL